jgi:hypothetical protein
VVAAAVGDVYGEDGGGKLPAEEEAGESQAAFGDKGGIRRLTPLVCRPFTFQRLLCSVETRRDVLVEGGMCLVAMFGCHHGGGVGAAQWRS